VALAIAFTKMFLVIYFFMHLRGSSSLVRVTLIAAFFWLALLIAFTSSDYHTRSWSFTPSSWSTSAPPTHP
jgi:cytochrome c oxidase subunit 4